MYINEQTLKNSTWQAFERLVSRLLLYEGYSGVRLVGQTKDRGADILAHKFDKRWLFQVKHWKQKVGLKVVDRTLEAMKSYRAHIPAIVALSGFDNATLDHQRTLLSRSTPLQLWDSTTLLVRAKKIKNDRPVILNPRYYQEDVIQSLVLEFLESFNNKALIVMATGLGKTFVAAEAIRRINVSKKIRVLAIAHTNELVYQLERAFWPFLNSDQETIIWNGYERPEYEDLERSQFVFCCLNTISDYLTGNNELPPFDIILIDECHHVGGKMYLTVLDSTNAGKENGPFLLGLTATPWRPGDEDIFNYFDQPLACIDIVTGLKKGFL